MNFQNFFSSFVIIRSLKPLGVESYRGANPGGGHGGPLQKREFSNKIATFVNGKIQVTLLRKTLLLVSR